MNDIQNYLPEDEQKKIYQEMRERFIKEIGGTKHIEAVNYAIGQLKLAGGPFAKGYLERLYSETASARKKLQDSKILRGYATKAENLFHVAFDYLRKIGGAMYIGDLESKISTQIIEPLKTLAGAAEMRASEEAIIDHILPMVDLSYTADMITNCLDDLGRTEWSRSKPIMRRLRRLCDKYLKSKIYLKENDGALRDFARANLLVEILWIAATGALGDTRGFYNKRKTWQVQNNNTANDNPRD